MSHILQFPKTCRYVLHTQTFIILNSICFATSKLSVLLFKGMKVVMNGICFKAQIVSN